MVDLEYFSVDLLENYSDFFIDFLLEISKDGGNTTEISIFRVAEIYSAVCEVHDNKFNRLKQEEDIKVLINNGIFIKNNNYLEQRYNFGIATMILHYFIVDFMKEAKKIS